MAQRIESCTDLVRMIDEWGFVPLFKNRIPGFSVEEHTDPSLWFAEGVDGPWEWKGPAIRESGCAYGKYFEGKAVFISRAWFPDFANFRRDGYDFDARYEDGLAGWADKFVYELLDGFDSLSSKELKRLGDFRKGGRKGFDSIITRLQMQGYVTTTDFRYAVDRSGQTYGWGIAQYAVPERHFGAAFSDLVYAREPEESCERIFRQIKSLFPETENRLIETLVGTPSHRG